MSRLIRDILGEALWLEPGIMRRPWAAWDRVAPDETERKRLQADTIIRILVRLGVTLVRTGEEIAPAPIPTSPEIYRYPLIGSKAERAIRKGAGDEWSIVLIEGAQERVEHTFTLTDAQKHAGFVLTGDPIVPSIKNLGKGLAGALEVYRREASMMEAPL